MNLIIGKNSFIAKQLMLRNEYCTTSSTNDSGDYYLDLKNPEEFDYSVISATTNIILLAAISSPDQCNNNFEEAYQINVAGTKKFITRVIEKGARVLFFSSDVVYGNTIKIVDENSLTNPFGKYAQMKDEIEKEFEHNSNFKVFRLSYVLSQKDKYLRYLHQCLLKGEVAEVFDPFVRKVVYIEDLLDAIENILLQWDHFSSSKFNICGGEAISRKDIALYYSQENQGKLKYTLITPEENFWKARPKDINISSLYLEKLLGRKPIKIQDAIKTIVKGEK